MFRGRPITVGKKGRRNQSCILLEKGGAAPNAKKSLGPRSALADKLKEKKNDPQGPEIVNGGQSRRFARRAPKKTLVDDEKTRRVSTERQVQDSSVRGE